MKLQPTLVRESNSPRITRLEAARCVRLLRRLGAEIKRYDRKDGRAYIARIYTFSSTITLTKLNHLD
jgi:hypothetical protein